MTTSKARVFVQWKGTDVCLDFWCACGAHIHYDGDFAYHLQCPHCQSIWDMPCNFHLRPAIDPSCNADEVGSHKKPDHVCPDDGYVKYLEDEDDE